MPSALCVAILLVLLTSTCAWAQPLDSQPPSCEQERALLKAQEMILQETRTTAEKNWAFWFVRAQTVSDENTLLKEHLRNIVSPTNEAPLVEEEKP